MAFNYVIVVGIFCLIGLFVLLMYMIFISKNKNREDINSYHFFVWDNDINLTFNPKDLKKFDLGKIKTLGDNSYVAWISTFSLQFIIYLVFMKEDYCNEFMNLIRIENKAKGKVDYTFIEKTAFGYNEGNKITKTVKSLASKDMRNIEKILKKCKNDTFRPSKAIINQTSVHDRLKPALGIYARIEIF